MVFSVGQIGFSVDAHLSRGQSGCLHLFESDAAPEAFCAMAEEAPRLENCIFDSNLTWRLYQQEEQLVVGLYRGNDRRVYQSLTLNADYTQASAYAYLDELCWDGPAIPLDGALFQIWANFLLTRQRGILVHALGVEIDGKAYLFVGKSGCGKSTLARLFAEAHLGTILSDDRIIIRRNGASFEAFGTPWNGEPQYQSSRHAPIAAIYFLRQTPSCILETVSPSESAAALFSFSFLAGWPRDAAVGFVLETVEQVSTQLECYRFGFVPSQAAISMLDLK